MSSRSTIDLSEALATLPVVHWTTRSVIAYSLEAGTSEDYARYGIPFGTAFGSFGQWHRVTAASPRFGRALSAPEQLPAAPTLAAQAQTLANADVLAAPRTRR